MAHVRFTEDDFVDYLKQVEGVRTKPYRDPAGVLTIGVGHRMTEREHERWLRGVPLDVEQLLRVDIAAALEGAHFVAMTYKHGFWLLPDLVKYGLADFVFNLGIDGTLAFKKFVPAFLGGDREVALREYKRYYFTSKGEKRELRHRNQMFRKTFLQADNKDESWQPSKTS